jgi:2-hydroxy-3-keto-5-methylthiopentenyl-1-phosphate phosphatase
MKKLTIISDFDGTIVIYDVFEKILDKFANDDWRLYDYLVEEGKMNLEDAILKQFSMISHLKEFEILEYAKNFLIEREYASNLIAFCDENNIEFIIASAGLSTYIKYFLTQKLINAKVYCLEVNNYNGKLFGKFPKFNGNYKNFKEAIVEKYKKDNFFVIYVGDGFNDVFPAVKSNKIFAVEDSLLSKNLDKLKIAHEKFVSFKKILDYLKNSF